MESLLRRLSESVTTDSPVPVYHQVAAVVRWEVRAGRLPVGAPLPPIRRVAAELGINFHTARRAWEELALEGTISLRPGRGARVERVPVDSDWSAAPVSPVGGASGSPRLWVVSRSLEQSARLAGLLPGNWQVEATAWPLDASPPPPGLILLAGLAAPDTWQAREADFRPMDLVLEPGTLNVIRQLAQRLGHSAVALVGGTREPALADLRRQLPRLGLAVSDATEVAAALEQKNALVLVTGAAWDGLGWGERVLPGVIPLDFAWSAGALARVGAEVRSEK